MGRLANGLERPSYKRCARQLLFLPVVSLDGKGRCSIEQLEELGIQQLR